jgi:hypothetical protein
MSLRAIGWGVFTSRESDYSEEVGMSVSKKQFVHGNKKAFSLMLSALFVTVVLGSPVISLAQEQAKATAQKTGETTACSAAEDQQAGAGQCTQTADTKEKGSPQASAKTIFSNLGKGSELFDPANGLQVSGPNSQPGTQAVGFPFIPKTNINLEGMEVPIGWYSGLDSVEVCIYADVAGLPGTIVQCVTVYNMYPFGGGFLYPNCIWELPRPFYPWPCVCLNVWPWDPFPLFAGTRYWVVVYPDPNEPDFWGYWYLNYKHTEGEIATFNQATGTWQATKGIEPAIALYGK